MDKGGWVRNRQDFNSFISILSHASLSSVCLISLPTYTLARATVKVSKNFFIWDCFQLLSMTWISSTQTVKKAIEWYVRCKFPFKDLINYFYGRSSSFHSVTIFHLQLVKVNRNHISSKYHHLDAQEMLKCNVGIFYCRLIYVNIGKLLYFVITILMFDGIIFSFE